MFLLACYTQLPLPAWLFALVFPFLFQVSLSLSLSLSSTTTCFPSSALPKSFSVASPLQLPLKTHLHLSFTTMSFLHTQKKEHGITEVKECVVERGCVSRTGSQKGRAHPTNAPSSSHRRHHCSTLLLQLHHFRWSSCWQRHWTPCFHWSQSSQTPQSVCHGCQLPVHTSTGA